MIYSMDIEEHLLFQGLMPMSNLYSCISEEEFVRLEEEYGRQACFLTADGYIPVKLFPTAKECVEYIEKHNRQLKAICEKREKERREQLITALERSKKLCV